MAQIRTYFGSELRELAPGVSVQQTAVAPDGETATGVPLFIGFAAVREANDGARAGRPLKPLSFQSWDQFARQLQPPAGGGYLAYAVRGFFENGGGHCVVLPLSVPEQDPSSGAWAAALRSLFKKEVYRAGHEGLRGVLDDVDGVDLVCVPDLMTEAVRGAGGAVFELQREVLDYCKDRGERFAILDTLPGGAAGVDGSIRHWQELVASEGALYFPWVLVKTLDGRGEVHVPPCGHIAGVYSRTDARSGFHRAPANETLEGVLDLQSHVSEEINRRLNESGVNCLRSFFRRGIRVWGARTLSGHRQWRYVNVRRIFLNLTGWIQEHMNDLVFEQNSPELWDRVKARLEQYCFALYKRGALKGGDPAEAYFIKCDAELNPAEVRDAGQLICEVGLAPLVPAEFILVRITQSAAGATVTLPAR